jgi:hypothetical protein
MIRRASAWRMTSHGNVVVATPSTACIRGGVPDGRGGPTPLAPIRWDRNLRACPVRGIARHGSQLWFGCDRRLCVEERWARFRSSGRRKACRKTPGTPSPSTPDGSVWARSAKQALPEASRRCADDGGKTGHRIQHLLGRLDYRPGRIGDGPDRQGSGGPPRGQLDGNRRAARTPHGHDQRCVGRSGRNSVDWANRRRRSPLARLRGMGSLDYGPRPAVQPDLEHPPRQEGRAVVGNLRWAWRGSMGSGRSADRGAGKTDLGGDNVRWLGETSDGAIWAVVKPGQRGAHRSGDRQGSSVRRRGTGSLARPRIAVSSTTWAGCGPRQPCGVFRNDQAVRLRPLSTASPQPASLDHGAWAILRRPGGDHVDHQSGRAVEPQRWPVAAVPESGRAAQRRPVHYDHRVRTALIWLHHRFDAGIERVELSGNRIVRIRPRLCGCRCLCRSRLRTFTPSTTLGRLWRGSSDGVSCPGRRLLDVS